SSFPFLLDAGAGFDSYEWQDGSAGQTFNATDYGLYWVSVLENGCPGADTINLIGVGVDEPSSIGSELQVFPNPSNGEFLIIAESINGWVEIGIYNVLGSCIYHEKVHATGMLDHHVRLEYPVRGPYLLKVGDRIKKIVVN
ncbi:MAG: T9SS type A sorting domain-containing protein, partial [Bacteroidales bacterium]|nr:T9SS type A sorting domain-containing protein [Bacteroidales bacterium]